MIIGIVAVVVREDALMEALGLCQEHVERSREEAGCLLHSVHQDVKNPNRLVFVEQWSDMRALDAHANAAASMKFGETLAALTVEGPDVSIYEATQVQW